MSQQSIDWDKVRAEIEKSGLTSSTRMLAVMPQHDPVRALTSTCDGICPVREIYLPKGSNNGYYRS